MMKNIYKILPYFIVEWLAKNMCERINCARSSEYIQITIFTDTVLTIKR